MRDRNILQTDPPLICQTSSQSVAPLAVMQLQLSPAIPAQTFHRTEPETFNRNISIFKPRKTFCLMLTQEITKFK